MFWLSRQLNSRGVENLQKCRFIEWMEYFMSKIDNLVKLEFRDSWFSHVGCSTCLIASKGGIWDFNLTFCLL